MDNGKYAFTYFDIQRPVFLIIELLFSDIDNISQGCIEPMPSNG